MWALFLDDERFPSEDMLMQFNVKICRTVSSAIEAIETYGVPEYMTLDHDLGPDELTGYDFAKWFVNFLVDTGIEWNYNYYIHSQNPVGKANIEGLISSYKKFSNKKE